MTKLGLPNDEESIEATQKEEENYEEDGVQTNEKADENGNYECWEGNVEISEIENHDRISDPVNSNYSVVEDHIMCADEECKVETANSDTDEIHLSDSELLSNNLCSMKVTEKHSPSCSKESLKEMFSSQENNSSNQSLLISRERKDAAIASEEQNSSDNILLFTKLTQGAENFTLNSQKIESSHLFQNPRPAPSSNMLAASSSMYFGQNPNKIDEPWLTFGHKKERSDEVPSTSQSCDSPFVSDPNTSGANENVSTLSTLHSLPSTSTIGNGNHSYHCDKSVHSEFNIFTSRQANSECTTPSPEQVGTIIDNKTSNSNVNYEISNGSSTHTIPLVDQSDVIENSRSCVLSDMNDPCTSAGDILEDVQQANADTDSAIDVLNMSQKNSDICSDLDNHSSTHGAYKVDQGEISCATFHKSVPNSGQSEIEEETCNGSASIDEKKSGVWPKLRNCSSSRSISTVDICSSRSGSSYTNDVNSRRSDDAEDIEQLSNQEASDDESTNGSVIDKQMCADTDISHSGDDHSEVCDCSRSSSVSNVNTSYSGHKRSEEDIEYEDEEPTDSEDMNDIDMLSSSTKRISYLDYLGLYGICTNNSCPKQENSTCRIHCADQVQSHNKNATNPPSVVNSQLSVYSEFTICSSNKSLASEDQRENLDCKYTYKSREKKRNHTSVSENDNTSTSPSKMSKRSSNSDLSSQIEGCLNIPTDDQEEVVHCYISALPKSGSSENQARSREESMLDYCKNGVATPRSPQEISPQNTWPVQGSETVCQYSSHPGDTYQENNGLNETSDKKKYSQNERFTGEYLYSITRNPQNIVQRARSTADDTHTSAMNPLCNNAIQQQSEPNVGRNFHNSQLDVQCNSPIYSVSGGLTCPPINAGHYQVYEGLDNACLSSSSSYTSSNPSKDSLLPLEPGILVEPNQVINDTNCLAEPGESCMLFELALSAEDWLRIANFATTQKQALVLTCNAATRQFHQRIDILRSTITAPGLPSGGNKQKTKSFQVSWKLTSSKQKSTLEVLLKNGIPREAQERPRTCSKALRLFVWTLKKMKAMCQLRFCKSQT